MTTKKSSVTPKESIVKPIEKTPEKQVNKKSAIEDVHQMMKLVDDFYTRLENEKRIASTDFLSKSNFENMHVDVQAHKNALKAWYEFLEK
jgi:hypothetical protein